MIEDDDEELQSEVKQWYQANKKTQLDIILSIFDLKDKGVKIICVPNHNSFHWSVLDVKVLPNQQYNNCCHENILC